MVAVTYGASATAAAKPTRKSKGFFMIVLEAIAETQMKRAEHALDRNRHLLPPDSDRRRGGLNVRNEEEPFGGW